MIADMAVVTSADVKIVGSASAIGLPFRTGAIRSRQRRRETGLGRAVNLFALQRLRDEGATTALVACRGDAAYPIPCKLYESVGFREVVRYVPFARP